jgi:hypothetical protein
MSGGRRTISESGNERIGMQCEVFQGKEIFNREEGLEGERLNEISLIKNQT